MINSFDFPEEFVNYDHNLIMSKDVRELSEISKNTFSYRTRPVVVSENIK